MPADARSLYYPVILVPGRSGTGRDRPGPFRWLKPCDHPREAEALIVRAMADEGATMGFVVLFAEGEDDPRILVDRTKPTAARNAIQKYLSLVDLIEREHP
jgi:hypothetical protein